MTLAHCPQADDDAEAPIGDAGLVRCRHNRGVGERGAFEGVLVHEVGADETPHLAGQPVGVRHQMGHHREALREGVVEFEMSLAVASLELTKGLRDIVGPQRQHAVDQTLDPGLTFDRALVDGQVRLRDDPLRGLGADGRAGG